MAVIAPAPEVAVSPGGRDSTGALFYAVIGSSGLLVRRSTDQGATYSTVATFTGVSYSLNGSASSIDLAVDQDDNVHVVLNTVGSVDLYSLRLTDATARTYTTATLNIASSSGSDYLYRAKVAAHRVTDTTAADGWIVHTAHVHYNGYIVHTINRLTSAGLAQVTSSTLTHNGGGSNYNQVAIAFEWTHAVDGRTRNGPANLLLVAQTANAGTYCASAWVATHTPGVPGTWAWSSRYDNLGNIRLDGDCLDTVWDGSRWLLLIGGITDNDHRFGIYVLSTSTGQPSSNLYFNSVTNANYSAAAITSSLFRTTARLAYDASGNLYVWGQDADLADDTTHVLRKFSGGSFGSALLTAAPASSSAYPLNMARIRRAAAYRSTVDVSYAWYGGSDSTRDARSDRLILNTAPNAATITAPTSGANVDRTSAITGTWTFSDPDSGDSQSKADVRYRIPASTSTWTTVTGAASTGTSYTWPANTFAAGAQVEWQVLEYDSQGVPAANWSSSSYFTAATPPAAPTFTSPASASTISASSQAYVFSAPNVDSFTWRVMGDTSGSASTTVVAGPTTVTDGTQRTFTVTGLANNQTVHAQVQVTYQGLTSGWADDGAQPVSYTPPAAPTITLNPVVTQPAVWTAADAIDVAITNPAPGSGQPTVVSHDIYVNDGSTEGLRRVATGVAAGSTWRHWTPTSLRDYTGGRIVVVAIAANGTTSRTSS